MAANDTKSAEIMLSDDIGHRDEPKEVIEIARSFLATEASLNLSRYDRAETYEYAGVFTVNFAHDVSDPPETGLKGYTDATSAVFVDKASKRVVGYVGPNKIFENKFYVTVRADTIQAIINFIGPLDARFADFSPQQYLDLFRLEAIDAGEIYLVDIISGPIQPGKLFVGGGYQFFVRKSNNEVLGFAPTF